MPVMPGPTSSSSCRPPPIPPSSTAPATRSVSEGTDPVPPNVDRMLEAVAVEVGLDDYGDPSFREGLQHLVDSANRQAGLTEFGEAVLDAQCRGALANRLRVTDWYRHHPALANEVIEAPIFIVGLSRT